MDDYFDYFPEEDEDELRRKRIEYVSDTYESIDFAIRHVRQWPWPGTPRVTHDGTYVLVLWDAIRNGLSDNFLLQMFWHDIVAMNGDSDYIFAWLRHVHGILPLPQRVLT